MINFSPQIKQLVVSLILEWIKSPEPKDDFYQIFIPKLILQNGYGSEKHRKLISKIKVTATNSEWSYLANYAKAEYLSFLEKVPSMKMLVEHLEEKGNIIHGPEPEVVQSQASTQISQNEQEMLTHIANDIDKREQYKKEIIAKERNDLKGFCEQQNIVNLCHFTNVAHFKSIIDKGLFSRSYLENKVDQKAISFTDYKRLDNYKNAINLSISFPNYLMFHKYKVKNPAEWIVILLDPRLIWELECGFSNENAASRSEISKDMMQVKGIHALRSLFLDFQDVQREKLGIPKNFPTNPQAEVLVFDPIPTKYISAVHFYPQDDLQEFCPQTSGKDINFVTSDEYFRPRCDWEYWKWRKNNLQTNPIDNINKEIDDINYLLAAAE